MFHRCAVAFLLIFSTFHLAVNAAEPAGGNRGPEITKCDDPQLRTLIEKYVKEHRLNHCVPVEWANCASDDGTDPTTGKKVWTELWVEGFIGLAHIESTCQSGPKSNTPNDANGKPSRGLFQMTGGDSALGHNCFGTTDPNSEEPYNAEKNVECAVRKMIELLLGGTHSPGDGDTTRQPKDGACGSLFVNAKKYWGPFKEGNANQHKAKNLVNELANHCGRSSFDASVIETGGPPSGDRARGNKPRPQQR